MKGISERGDFLDQVMDEENFSAKGRAYWTPKFLQLMKEEAPSDEPIEVLQATEVYFDIYGKARMVGVHRNIFDPDRTPYWAFGQYWRYYKVTADQLTALMSDQWKRRTMEFVR